MTRKIRLSALLAVAVMMLALLIGGLYGYFGDTEDSDGNSFTAGILDLEGAVAGTSSAAGITVVPADPPNSAAGHVEFGTVAPGIKPSDNGTITWTLTNVGNVNGNANFSVAALGVTNDENTIYEPEAQYGDVTDPDGELGGVMQVTLDVRVDGGAWVNEYSGSLDGLAGDSGTARSLNPGAHTVDYRLTWSVPDGTPATDDVIMSDIATLDIVFSLTQV
jgi:predicted ribosomally synthesized peptide with SipW-like signal peptide